MKKDLEKRRSKTKEKMKSKEELKKGNIQGLLLIW